MEGEHGQLLELVDPFSQLVAFSLCAGKGLADFGELAAAVGDRRDEAADLGLDFTVPFLQALVIPAGFAQRTGMGEVVFADVEFDRLGQEQAFL